ncbi:hypothetical protein [Streptococcus oriscaviae]|uniref:Uncharacterized protein n=1 Tax=Streptococcus oriscaviae TaxID=2781599 RepID=A0ABX7YIE4_9STRE|nr:hypothetical protein [Streptococcus oriscaviae]QUE53566.1 hypothetical protein INT76_06795 [Streptococcus oriscaviae]
MKIKDFLKQVMSDVRLEVAEYDDFYNGYVTTEVFTGRPEDILEKKTLSAMQENFLGLDISQVEFYQFKNNGFTCICITQRIGENVVDEDEELSKQNKEAVLAFLTTVCIIILVAILDSILHPDLVYEIIDKFKQCLLIWTI